MKKLIYFQFIITLFVLTFYSFTVNAQSGTLKGTITDAITKKPIPFVEVSIYNYSKFSVFITDTIKTNINGEYCFNFIPTGTYFLSVKSEKYFCISINKVLLIKNSIICKDFCLIIRNQNNNTTWTGSDCSFFEFSTSLKNEPFWQSYTSEEINKMAW